MNKINYFYITNILGQWMRMLWYSLSDDCARQKFNLCPCYRQNLKNQRNRNRNKNKNGNSKFGIVRWVWVNGNMKSRVQGLFVVKRSRWNWTKLKWKKVTEKIENTNRFALSLVLRQSNSSAISATLITSHGRSYSISTPYFFLHSVHPFNSIACRRCRS